jgi:hypothetical protein
VIKVEIVKWVDFYGEEHVLMEGKNDDIFHSIPNRKDEEGNSFVQMLSKKAIIEMANKLQST